jgi:hypothetical protein
VHSGFVAPTNDSTFGTLRGGWTKVFRNVGTVAGELC